jgi:phage terminase large subunit-like protein
MIWHEYAEDIRSGDIVACKSVKQAVERYFSNLSDPQYLFNAEKVKKVIAFSKLCPHVTGSLRGQSFTLEPWQQFIIANIFGFIRVETGTRKYKTVYIEVPRKSGKSSFAAIIVNWFLVCEKGNQDIYTAAVSRDQARIVFDAARQMALISPVIKKRVKMYQHHIIEPKSNSVLKPLAAKANTIEGTNPSLAIVDEYHLHPDNSVYSSLSLGMGSRAEPLLVAITTAGTDTLSACMVQHQHIKRVLEGTIEDHSYFGMIYSLDEEAEYQDETKWIKANPNLGVSVFADELRAQVARAENLNSTKTEMLTKRFNIWCQGDQQWIKPESWRKCGKFDIEEVRGRPCYVGLDLSSSKDITAIGMVFPTKDGIRVSGRYYIPEEIMNNPENKNADFYRGWVSKGYLIATPGNLVDYDYIKRDILEFADDYQVHSISYDPWNATYLTTQLSQEGLDIEKVRQGFLTMSPACKEFEVYVEGGRVEHDNNPVLNWAMANVVIETDAAGNIKPTKAKSPNKIDPVAAIINAFATYMLEIQEENLYQNRGFVSV